MTADQLIEHDDGSLGVVEDVGRLGSGRPAPPAPGPGRGFARSVGRGGGGGPRLVTDRKTGFCLGDRYRVPGGDLPARPREPVYTGRCGLGRTGLGTLTEGISVGYGDVYEPNLEGQSLRLAGLPAGRYILLHRVNVGRRLRETSYANNAASILVRLGRQGHRPSVRVMRRCADAAHCAPRPRRSR